MASSRCSTIPSLGTLSAAAVFSLVENRFPAAFPPLRSDEDNGGILVLHQSLGDIAGVAFNVVLDGDDLSEERFLD